MRTLAGMLFRVGALACGVALAVVIAGLVLAEVALERRLARALPPDLMEEFRAGEVMSPELIAGIEALDGGLWAWGIPLVAVVGGLLAGGAVGVLASRRLVRPIAGLAQAARRLGEGDLAARAPEGPGTAAEIARFIDDFNAMAARAEAALRERREAQAAIGHELRTPLTVLSGRIEGMIDGVFPLDRAALLALRGQVALLGRIVEDLRLLSLAEAGRLALDRAPVDLAREAGAVLAAMEPILGEAVPGGGGAPVERALASAPATGDAIRLRQALQALLTNAARHGGGAIRVETGQDAGGPFLRVLDRGPGLSPDQAARAFERFWRAEAARGREGGGSGLGLSVVEAIARAHGGRALYRDRPGGGAAFELRLPPREAAAPMLEASILPATAHRASAP